MHIFVHVLQFLTFTILEVPILENIIPQIQFNCLMSLQEFTP